MRTLRLVLPLAILAVLVSTGAEAQKKKLYRWTDANGEVHYTDQLPPQAAEAARDELNSSGMAVDSIQRALTPEERAVQDAETARLAELQRQLEEKSKMDAVLLASYPTEDDLARAYKERFDLIERSVESAQVGISSQERSLADMLAHAAGLEREGKPVPETVVKSIGLTRAQVGEQRAFLGKRQGERVLLQKEYDDVLARYRELKSESTASTD